MAGSGVFAYVRQPAAAGQATGVGRQNKHCDFFFTSAGRNAPLSLRFFDVRAGGPPPRSGTNSILARQNYYFSKFIIVYEKKKKKCLHAGK